MEKARERGACPAIDARRHLAFTDKQKLTSEQNMSARQQLTDSARQQLRGLL